jgi:enolase-phosphatase E1
MKRPAGILLDIEGTTSSISFVHEVMFPYVTERLHDFLVERFEREDVQGACEQIARDAGYDSLQDWTSRANQQSARELVEAEVRRLMEQDAKATGLKALQGIIWHDGFQNGTLKAHVFPDVIPAIRGWRRERIDVRIYSSGSVATQKLFFGNLEDFGDCLDLFSGHYDTTMGGKKERESYRRIASDWGLATEDILFVSDVAEELRAAREAGLMVLVSVRLGNKQLPERDEFSAITSFDQIHFETSIA